MPLARVTRGQPRLLVTGPKPSSAALRAKIPAIPKLTAWVRLPAHRWLVSAVGSWQVDCAEDFADSHSALALKELQVLADL